MQPVILNHSAILPLKIAQIVQPGDFVTFRIIDDEGTMIAKVNGRGNLKACEQMIHAFNVHDKMKSLLKNRLKEILQDVSGSALIAICTREWIREGKNFEVLIEQLKSQANDNPAMMISVIGGEAFQILQVL